MPPASASPARRALPAADAAGPNDEKIPAPTIEPSPMTTASPVPSLRASAPVTISSLGSRRFRHVARIASRCRNDLAQDVDVSFLRPCLLALALTAAVTASGEARTTPARITPALEQLVGQKL